ncbi:hypothetical protein CSA37_12910 [Candidatus Fermentibacteria bacterium]|nr:MAG: hypothetical protein CSA37_12910 [Candidatus Fermentibacteria bacterium]
MALRANRVRLGIFFVLIMGIFITGIFWVAGGFSSPVTTSYACYFGWSVGGLNVGSTVEYNGVPVGSVSAIEIAPDGRLVKVVLNLEDDKFRVDDTIVASLFFTGITGLQDINLESLPDSVERLWSEDQLTFESDMPVVPVRSGTVQSVASGLNAVFQSMAQVDMKELNDQTIRALTRMNDLLDSVENDSVAVRLSRTIDNFDAVLVTYNDLGNELTAAIRDAREDAEPIVEDLKEFTGELDNLSEQLNMMGADLHNTFNVTNSILQEIRELLPNVNRLLDGFSGGYRGEEIWQ